MTKMRVWKTSEDTFEVSSQSQKGRHYTVQMDKAIVANCPRAVAVWACSCPHFEFRQVETCKHIERVKEAIATEDYLDGTELASVRTELKKLSEKMDELRERIDALSVSP